MGFWYTYILYLTEVTELYFSFLSQSVLYIFRFQSAFEIVFGGMAKIVYCKCIVCAKKGKNAIRKKKKSVFYLLIASFEQSL